jgi:hypothetical protein
LGDEGGLDPIDGAGSVLRDSLEGGFGDTQFDELGEEITTELLRETGAGSAGVDEVARSLGAALHRRIVAEKESADAVGAFAREGEAGDDEFLLVEALGL